MNDARIDDPALNAAHLPPAEARDSGTQAQPAPMRRFDRWLIGGAVALAVPTGALAFWFWGRASAGYLVDLVAAYCF